MAELNGSKQLSVEKLQTILKNDHIRQHLIRVGLINSRGDIIPRDEPRRRSKPRRGRQVSNSQRTHPITSTQSLLITRETTGTLPNSQGRNRTRSPNGYSNERPAKSASTAPSKQAYKSQPSTRFSSSKQSANVQNVLLRRAVNPEIIPEPDRCTISMMYFGPEIHIEYDREWFEPDGDEIIVMQQHCGGENLIVFKGLLKPNEEFKFESRRHKDYPFALAFYINGVINNRLSICCESRYKSYVRISGKRGLFAITSTEKAQPCRRCRFDQRMKQLTDAEKKPAIKPDQRQVTGETNEESSQQLLAARSPINDTTSSEQSSANQRSLKPLARNTENTRPSTASVSHQEQSDSDRSIPEAGIVAHSRNQKPSAPRISSPESVQSDALSSKHSASQMNGSMSNQKQNNSYPSNSHPNGGNSRDKKPSSPRISSPECAPSDSFDSESSVTQSKNSMSNVIPVFDRKQNNLDPSVFEQDKTREVIQKPRSPRISSPESVRSDAEPQSTSMTKQKSSAPRLSSPESVRSDTLDTEPQGTSMKKQKPDKPRVASPQSVESDTSKPKSNVSHSSNSKINNLPVANAERQDSDSSTAVPSISERKSTKPNQSRRSRSVSTTSEESDSKLISNHVKTSTRPAARKPNPREVDSDNSSPEPTTRRITNSETKGTRKLNRKLIGSDSSDASIDQSKDSRTAADRKSHHKEVQPDISDSEDLTPRTTNSKPNKFRRSSSEERDESPLPRRIPSATVVDRQRKTTQSTNNYTPDFEQSEDKVGSPSSVPHKKDSDEASSVESFQKKSENPRRSLNTSSESDLEDSN